MMTAGPQDAILFWMHNGLTEAQARTQAAAEAFDSLAAQTRCKDGRGILHDHPAEGWLTLPNGKHVGQMCERHARDVIDEYSLKLSWSWTFQPYRLAGAQSGR